MLWIALGAIVVACAAGGLALIRLLATIAEVYLPEDESEEAGRAGRPRRRR